MRQIIVGQFGGMHKHMDTSSTFQLFRIMFVEDRQ